MRPPTRQLSLEQLTIDDAQPADLVSIAADLGCEYVSLFLRPAARPPQWHDLVTDQAKRRGLRRLMADRGIAAHTVDFFPLSPRVKPDDYDVFFDCAADLGAGCVSVLVSDPDERRRLNAFCVACERARAYGLKMNLEFVAITALPSLASALQLLQEAKQPNAGLMVDILHLMRSGGTVDDLARVPPEQFGGVQVCDGPMTAPPDQLHEALRERRLPGSGEFPLREFLGIVPEGLPIGVEAPSASLRALGLSPAERASRAVAATREVLARLSRDSQ